MYATMELARLTMADRQRDADRWHLAALAQRIADCCRQLTIRGRLAATARRGVDLPPSTIEFVVRALRMNAGR